MLRFFGTGEGSKRIRFPFSLPGEKGLGDEGENDEVKPVPTHQSGRVLHKRYHQQQDESDSTRPYFPQI